MPTFIKTGYWESAVKSYKGWLNLEDLIFNIIPSQTGNAGKYLKTDGSTLSWASVVAPNIYTDNGTLTGNRIVNSGGFSLTLNPNTNLAGSLFGNTLRTRNSFSGSYTQSATVFSNGVETFDGLTSTGNTLYMGQSNIEVTGGSSIVQSQGIDIEQNIKLSGSNSRISAINYLIQYRGYAGDISTNANNFMAGMYTITGHSRYDTTTNIVTGNAYGNFSNVTNNGGTIINTYGYNSALNASTFSATKSSTITNFYAFRSTSRIGASSGPTATVTNYYGLLLDTPTVASTGTITNRWGVYAPDVAMRHYLNGNLLLGSTTDTGLYKLDVNGTARVSGTIRSTAAFGLELSAAASYLSFNNQQLLIGDAASLVGGGTIGLGFRGSAFVYGDGSIGYHYLTYNYALFSTQSGAVNLSTGIPASAVLEARSTTKGFLPPRMTTTEKNAIVLPAAGLVVYDITDNRHYGYNGTTWNAFY